MVDILQGPDLHLPRDGLPRRVVRRRKPGAVHLLQLGAGEPAPLLCTPQHREERLKPGIQARQPCLWYRSSHGATTGISQNNNLGYGCLDLTSSARGFLDSARTLHVPNQKVRRADLLTATFLWARVSEDF